MKEDKKIREGFEWRIVGSGGYWVKIDDFSRHSHKLPLFCPREECKKITSTIDDNYLKEYGVCSECYIKLVENRQKPLIDIEFYKKRYKDRGY